MTESRANRVWENGEWRYIDQTDAEFVMFSEPDFSVEAVDDLIDLGALPDDTIAILRGMRHDGLQAYIAGNVPLMEAHLSRLHMTARAAAMLAPAKTGRAHKKEQKRKARKPRAAVADNGETVTEIIERLAVSPEFEEETAMQLWDRFHGELDVIGMAPERDESNKDPRKWFVQYFDSKGKERTLSCGRFQTIVSEARSQKSR